MTEIIRKISVDLARRGNVRLIFARQHDLNSRKITIHLTNGGNPFIVDKTSIAIVNFLRPDGESGAFYGVIGDDGSVSITLGLWQLAVVGEVKCSVSIFSENDQKLTSANFYLDVEAALFDGNEITEDEKIPVLIDLISEISKINVWEEERKRAEEIRDDAEKLRVEAESSRALADAERSKIIGDIDNALDEIIVIQQMILDGKINEIYGGVE